MDLRKIAWKAINTAGHEELSLKELNGSIVATSQVTGGDTDIHTKWDAAYRIVCKNWRVREVFIEEKLSGHRLKIHSDGQGRWTNEQNEEIASIRGCIDIDFRATPFSNTFPIRRLHLGVGESSTIEVAYIDAPDLKITKERQVYTRLAEYEWKFEQPSAAFEAIITVDSDGFVLNYPELFKRIADGLGKLDRLSRNPAIINP